MKQFSLFVVMAVGMLISCEPEKTAEPPPCLRISKFQGDGQIGISNNDLTQSLIARVVDEAGLPQTGVPVEWKITEGDGSLLVLNETTSLSGDAEAIWTMGKDAIQRVECHIQQPRSECSGDSVVAAFLATTYGLFIKDIDGSVISVNPPACSGGNSYLINLRTLSPEDLRKYYVELEIERTASDNQKILITRQATRVNPNSLQETLIQYDGCNTFGGATWFDYAVLIRTYAKDNQGNKIGSPLRISNRSAKLRINKPAGANRIAAQ